MTKKGRVEQTVERVKFEEGADVAVYITHLGENLYRLNATPLFLDEEKATFGDVIEAERQEDGVLRFCRVVQRSTWRHWRWFLPRSLVESSAFTTFQQVIEQHGGLWEQWFGGIFIVHLPEGLDFDPQQEWDQLQAHIQAEEASQKSEESSEPLL